MVSGSAMARCCPCNGANAKCTRCYCVRNGRPCVSCLPGKSEVCQNSLGCRQRRAARDVSQKIETIDGRARK